MSKPEEQSLLTILKDIRSLIDKSLKTKLNLGDYTVPQTMIMYNLANNGRMKISDLSEKMGLTNSTVSGIVDRLEDQGVVTRQRCTDDRRVVHVELSSEHKKKREDLHDRLDKYFDEILADVPAEQIDSIYSSLLLLKSALESHLDSDS